MIAKRVEIDIMRMPSGDVRLRVKGPQKVLTILRQTFPTITLFDFSTANYGYDWYSYNRNIDDDDLARLTDFCGFLETVVIIDDDLEQCFALDFHSTGGIHTPTGALVRASKPYNSPVKEENKISCNLLAQHLIDFINRHPLYRQARYIIPVPPSTLLKSFDVPSTLAWEICLATGKTTADAGLRKIRATKPMKNCLTNEERITNIRGAFIADGEPFRHDDTLILVDDIYDSGITIDEVARTLRTSKATTILGLVATKTTL